jgi:hypothetical protein
VNTQTGHYVWTSVDDVSAHLGFGSFTAVDERALALAVAAANRCVQVWRPDLPPSQVTFRGGAYSADYAEAYATSESLLDVDPMIRQGATRLAASFYNRRGSMGGDYAGFDGAAMPAMPGVIDADIQALLGVGRHHGPVVA